MWIIALEAFVALCMLMLVVWLTMGGTRRRDADASKQDITKNEPEDRK